MSPKQQEEVLMEEKAPEAEALPERGEMKGESLQLVVFDLGDEEFGVEITQVREIMKMTDITLIPNSPPFIEGIINLRGKIVVAINLLERFYLEIKGKKESRHIIIAEHSDGAFGIIVDEVTEVLTIPKEDIRSTPSIIASKINSDYLKGVGLVGERLLVLLDLDKVLGEKELLEMMKTVKEYHRVISAKEAKEEKKAAEKAAEEREKQEKELKKKVKEAAEKITVKKPEASAETKEEAKSEEIKTKEAKKEEKPEAKEKVEDKPKEDAKQEKKE